MAPAWVPLVSVIGVGTNDTIRTLAHIADKYPYSMRKITQLVFQRESKQLEPDRASIAGPVRGRVAE